MAKKTKKSTEALPTAAPEEIKPGLDIKVKLEKTESGRVTVTVTLLNDGVEVASDYDFVNIN